MCSYCYSKRYPVTRPRSRYHPVGLMGRPGGTVGVAVGVAGVTALQARLPKAEAFVVCLVIAGLGFGAGVSMPTFWWWAACVGERGFMAGAV